MPAGLTRSDPRVDGTPMWSGRRHHGHGQGAGVVTFALLVILAACSSSPPATTMTSSTAAPAPAPPPSASTSSATPPSSQATSDSPATSAPAMAASTEPVASPTACTGGTADLPADAASRQIVDVDGDERADSMWIGTDDGKVVVGVVTAAGGGTTRRFDSAAPSRRSVLAFRVNDATPPIVLADDGRRVQLWAFLDCRLTDVLNVQNEPYEFSHGLTEVGTGVGCADVDGVQQLVGLDATHLDDGTITWSSTVVAIDGDQARNGAIETGTYMRPRDDGAIALLSDVTCGDLTIDSDGITVR